MAGTDWVQFTYVTLGLTINWNFSWNFACFYFHSHATLDILAQMVHLHNTVIECVLSHMFWQFWMVWGGWLAEAVGWYNIVMKRKQLWYLFLKYFVESDEAILTCVQVQRFCTEEIALLNKNKQSLQAVSICLYLASWKPFLWENTVFSYYNRVTFNGTKNNNNNKKRREARPRGYVYVVCTQLI